ncbi:hypothetical protein [Bradyrhizobium sp.]|jgi:hypothetical protein|uniref:hypothetical protein n=1 Tax=Bradyrhizobium sp. TaxID=376 RepID=UPI002E065E3C|nr:hypothetical protein [Bradyrhizobium sp.]
MIVLAGFRATAGISRNKVIFIGFPEGYTVWRRMIATDHLSPDKWLAHAEVLSAEQLQREMLRQATDTKLQLISI